MHQQQAHEIAIREAAQAASAMHFVAQPIPSYEPFVPKKSTKPVTIPEDVGLRLDQRVEERRAFDEARRQREQEEAEMRERARLEKEVSI
jgi:hypothetical protein